MNKKDLEPEKSFAQCTYFSLKHILTRMHLTKNILILIYLFKL